MRTRKILTAALAAIGLLSWAAVAAPAGKPQNPAGNVVEVFGCQVFWKDERIISSKIPGKIDRRLVEEGVEVEADDVLALLDDREAKLEYLAQKILGDSDLDERQQLEKLEEYLARMEAANRLIGPRAISKEEWRLSKVNVNVNELMAQKEVEKRKIEKIKAERSKTFLDDHTIRSPIKGMVVKCFKREKESVTSNELQMFQIVSKDVLWVEGDVAVKYYHQVRNGLPVEVSLPPSDDPDMPLSPGGTTFTGKVVFKDPNVDFQRKVFRVRAEVENRDDLLTSGLRANMKLQLAGPVAAPAR